MKSKFLHTHNLLYSLTCIILLHLLSQHSQGAVEFPKSFRVVQTANSPTAARDLITSPITIKSDKPYIKTFQIEVDNTSQIQLSILARIDSSLEYSGSTYAIEISLNGVPINLFRTRNRVILLNKPTVFYQTGLDLDWMNNTKLRLVYSKDFVSGKSQIAHKDNDPYTFILDIHDRLKANETNTLQIASLLPSSRSIIIGSMQILRNPPSHPVPPPMARRERPNTCATHPEGRLIAQDGAVIVCGADDTAYTINTRMSIPGGGWSHLGNAGELRTDATDANHLARGESNGDKHAVFQGRHYTVERKLDTTDKLSTILDTVTNTSNTDIGLAYKIIAPIHFQNIDDIYIAGNNDVNVIKYYSPYHPSLFVRSGEHNIGIISNDTILRAHSRLAYDFDNKAISISDNEFVLKAGQNYTFSWSVYYSENGDYFDFINSVRKEWNSNFEIQGPQVFWVPKSVEAQPFNTLKERLETLRPRYLCSGGGWVDDKSPTKNIGFGTAFTSPGFASYRKRMSDSVATLKKAYPEASVLIYFNCYRDSTSNSPSHYTDSKITNVDGTQLSTDWNKEFTPGEYETTYCFYPTLQNSFGQAMLKTVDSVLNETRADGVYWDEMSGLAYGTPFITYDAFDGFSADLDPVTFKILRKKGYVSILSEEFQMFLIKKLQSQGRLLVGNGPPHSRAVSDLHFPRFTETQHNSYWPREGHLYSPVGYSLSSAFSDVHRLLNDGILFYGNMLAYNHDVLKYFFPITPVSIKQGTIIGRERIITNQAGVYAINSDKKVINIHYFNESGKLIKTEHVDVPHGLRPMNVELRIEPGLMAVID
jgi:hypothetical protein